MCKTTLNLQRSFKWVRAWSRQPTPKPCTISTAISLSFLRVLKSKRPFLMRSSNSQPSPWLWKFSARTTFSSTCPSGNNLPFSATKFQHPPHRKVSACKRPHPNPLTTALFPKPQPLRQIHPQLTGSLWRISTVRKVVTTQWWEMGWIRLINALWLPSMLRVTLICTWPRSNSKKGSKWPLWETTRSARLSNTSNASLQALSHKTNAPNLDTLNAGLKKRSPFWRTRQFFPSARPSTQCISRRPTLSGPKRIWCASRARCRLNTTICRNPTCVRSKIWNVSRDMLGSALWTQTWTRGLWVRSPQFLTPNIDTCLRLWPNKKPSWNNYSKKRPTRTRRRWPIPLTHLLSKMPFILGASTINKLPRRPNAPLKVMLSSIISPSQLSKLCQVATRAPSTQSELKRLSSGRH